MCLHLWHKRMESNANTIFKCPHTWIGKLQTYILHELLFFSFHSVRTPNWEHCGCDAIYRRYTIWCRQQCNSVYAIIVTYITNVPFLAHTLRECNFLRFVVHLFGIEILCEFKCDRAEDLISVALFVCVVCVRECVIASAIADICLKYFTKVIERKRGYFLVMHMETAFDIVYGNQTNMFPL